MLIAKKVINRGALELPLFQSGWEWHNGLMLQNVTNTAWHHLTPSWQATPDILKRGLPLEQMAAPWQMLLLGDGSVTRHLQLMTGEEVSVAVTAMDRVSEEDGAPIEVNVIPAPRLRRQVWLMSASGQCLAYAASWWSFHEVDTYLKDRSQPIWNNLASRRTEHFRDLKGLFCGEDPNLSAAFGATGVLWGRYYLIWNQGQPRTLIYEVFSPLLSKSLGPVAKVKI